MTTFQEILTHAQTEIGEAEEAVASLNDAMGWMRDAGVSDPAIEADFHEAQRALQRIKTSTLKHLKT